MDESTCADDLGLCRQPPEELTSDDPDVLRAALLRESRERRRAECLAGLQRDVVQLALDLLVREPDIEGFFGALTKTVVEEGETQCCGVFLIDDAAARCEPWMAYVVDRLIIPSKAGDAACIAGPSDAPRFPCETMASHLYDFRPGWSETVGYERDDARLPDAVRAFSCHMNWDMMVTTPLALGSRNMGWMMISIPHAPDFENRWWRIALIEAIARQAALALHYSRLVDLNRREERRKAVLEERNRLARDIHDTLAQGFAAILMQLQGAQREAADLAPGVARSIETAVDLARIHLTEARRSVGALRPNVGPGEDLATALKRLADMRERTDGVPIDLVVEELPRLGDGVEREIVAIAQEALTNAVRHARAKQITIRAEIAQSVGVRLSVADDGRGIPRERPSSGFGMTSMQERAERIGASLTIVTAPRRGTEVVLAWDPSSLPTQVHAAF